MNARYYLHILTFSSLAAAPWARAELAVDFSSQIRPILSKNCYNCHGQDEHSRKAELRLDQRDEAVREHKNKGVWAIKPGDPAGSEVVRRIETTDPDDVMPPPKHGHALKAGEVALVRQWIREGAAYSGHWAFTKPVLPPVPQAGQGWARNSIDAFISEKWASQGLVASPEADRGTLARRVALDLTGLPPQPDELAAYLRDGASDAYEKYVDQLLASPAFGERWARVWLDLARYADSAGYGSDPLRLNIWPFRDWLISALNRNLPYDQFSREMLAGDLLPNATQEQMVATAFHRNTMTNTEGGTDDEEWRVAAVKDRTHVTMQVWMGLTMNCAQCHSHKFDPITQKEYYQMYALFNQTEDADRGDDAPTLPLPNPVQKEKTAALQGEITRLEASRQAGSPEFDAELRDWEKRQQREMKWTVLQPAAAKSEKGVELKVTEDGVVTAPKMESDSHTLEVLTDLKRITAVRLEALTDVSLPGQGPGHSPANFVLSEFRATSQSAAGELPKVARYVRIELPGEKRFLHLAEVQVFSAGQNASPKGLASQSSTDFGGPARFANDGNTDGDYSKKSVSHTKGEDNPWWEVDLGAELPVERIVVWNRTDGGTEDRTTNFAVTALNAQRQPVFTQKQAAAPRPSASFTVGGPQPVIWHHAAADFEQAAGWTAAAAIDGKIETGWAIAPQMGQPHVIVFRPSAPLILEGNTKLTFTVAQYYGANHTLAKYRLSVTDDSDPLLPLPTNIRAILAGKQRSGAQQDELRAYFRPYSQTLGKINQRIESLQKELAAIKPVNVPVLRELPEKKGRKTQFLNKGNFLDPGDEVQPGLPAAFGQLPKGAPMNRLGVVDWLFSVENPLTGRVAVNRLWAQLFGSGIVPTEEDFGTQGQLPSHRELLDWLALEYRSNGWDTKKLLRLIVQSATYRQASAVTEAQLRHDPSGKWLARYPRRRLDAEQVRDQALALSGLLSRKIGGPSVYPLQPDGLWKAAFNGERSYPTSTGEDRHRRGLYTIWRRTVPYPSMATFDAPSRESCTVRRVPTNTPLQAYVTLNDPVFIEAAQALGRRIVQQGGATAGERLGFAWRLVLGREPTPVQITTLSTLLESELQKFRDQKEAAVKLATDPLGPLPAGLDPAEAAAWTVIGNVLLNLDGVLMKS